MKRDGGCDGKNKQCDNSSCAAFHFYLFINCVWLLFGYFLRKTLASSLAKKAAMAMAKNDEAALKRLGS
ncbi:hypothetical protein, partial [Bacillus cereus group sp. Bce028]|uniref:hypothetical protein n=1 Tax=Bacillus cereus group sp. Bce028 TaxID=3445240 RepID=UPI003F69DFD2